MFVILRRLLQGIRHRGRSCTSYLVRWLTLLFWSSSWVPTTSACLLQLVKVLDQVCLQLQGKNGQFLLHVTHRMQVSGANRKMSIPGCPYGLFYEFLFSMWIPVHLQVSQFAFAFAYIHLSFPTSGLADLSPLRLNSRCAASSTSFYIG